MIKKLLILVLFSFINMISIEAYTSYNQGDKITYNGIEFYVLSDSLEDSNVLTLLKSAPLTKEEINLYGNGYINKYTNISQNEVYLEDGYANVAYYSSDTCKFVDGTDIKTGCVYDYESSDIKHIVDGWGSDKLTLKDLWKDELGYNYRLITKEEIIDNMAYKLYIEQSFIYSPITNKCPEWFYNNVYWTWTMTSINKNSPYGYAIKGVYNIGAYDEDKHYPGQLGPQSPYALATVRPVVLLKKSALNKKNTVIAKEESYPESSLKETNSSDNLIVEVPDTYIKISMFVIIIGFILVTISIVIYISMLENKVKNENKK